MKNILLIAVLLTGSVVLYAQESKEKVMEKRAREMHRVLTLNDKDAWKKFIQENYTQKLIDKPMRQTVQTSEDTGSGATGNSSTSTTSNLEAKVTMYGRLHEDFGKSKITSIKTTGETAEMILDFAEIHGVFTLTFEKNAPYLIDGLGIMVEQN